jgi:hypothetical protein
LSKKALKVFFGNIDNSVLLVKYLAYHFDIYLFS